MSGNEIFVHLFATGDAELNLDSQTVSIRQKTEYPWNGKVSIEILPEKNEKWTLSVRIPGWCRKASLKVNGKKISFSGIVKNGYAKFAAFRRERTTLRWNSHYRWEGLAQGQKQLEQKAL